MSSNIVAIVRYKKDVNFQKLVGGWCKYVSKDGADGKSLKDFSSSDELFDKEFGIYDDTIDNDVNYIWDKNGDVKKEDILINYENGYLTIKAVKKVELKTEVYVRRERFYGEVKRSFYIGEKKESDIKANYENGILTISFPKEETPKKEIPNITIK